VADEEGDGLAAWVAAGPAFTVPQAETTTSPMRSSRFTRIRTPGVGRPLRLP